ncbi:helix-turn-helix transcriptional regulator [Ancylothrix sp. C2]|uniref:helix-turn-helix domain-containing protein n=1 Tax=Ancylothrix sp. D3o TaxID=2953691 RepID=UPI0021BB11CF|nr:helix-turn-helix transcriptional regulator [Ancylothrix sp. D3o]MCT7952744.1 helix-turn-helix transcriptional regulator [Ancylothrix sp. D3o]
MSAQNHKKLQYTMIPVEIVARIFWDRDFGQKLKSLRGKTSRRKFAEQLEAKGVQCSHQYLQQIEDGRVETVDMQLIMSICAELNCSLSDIFTSIYIEMPG